ILAKASSASGRLPVGFLSFFIIDNTRVAPAPGFPARAFSARWGESLVLPQEGHFPPGKSALRLRSRQALCHTNQNDKGTCFLDRKRESGPLAGAANPLLRLLGTVYNRKMDALMQVLGPVLEWMFFIGMAGSALVIVISFIEDFNTIFEED